MEKENQKIFEKHQKNLSTAFYSNYAVNMYVSDIMEIAEAYRNETGIDILKGHNITCPSCNVKILKSIGKWYFDEIEKPMNDKVDESKTVKKEDEIKTKKSLTKKNGNKK